MNFSKTRKNGKEQGHKYLENFSNQGVRDLFGLVDIKFGLVNNASNLTFYVVWSLIPLKNFTIPCHFLTSCLHFLS